MANNNVQDFGSAVAEVNTILEKHTVDLEKSATALSKYNAELKVLPSGYLNTQKQIANEQKQQTKNISDLQAKLQKANEIAQREIEKTRLAEIKLSQAREKAFDNYEKKLQKEEAGLAKLEGAYQRYQNSVNVLTNTYKNLAIRKELGGTLNAKEEAQLLSITNRLNQYQNALKKVDAQIGNHQREVGNYAKANSNLSNSIGQISRELPNFGQSFSIGVLSLTNNVGALIDGIKQVKEQNNELQSQGKQTKSVFSQILSSVLSWQTALFIGIGIFSAYSKEISGFISDLFSANDAIKANERAIIDAYEARKRFEFASADATKQTRKEIDDYLNLTSVIKDNTKSKEERLNAVKRYKDAYPGYLKNFSDEQILAYQSGKANKELSKTINQLAADITKRNLAQSQANESSKTFSDLTDLKAEFKYRESINQQINSSNFSTRELYKKRAKERVEIVNDSEDFVEKFGKATINELGAYDLQEINNLKIRYNALVNEFNKERDTVNKSLVETSLLDFKPDEKKDNKLKREKVRLNFEEIESEYNLKLAILERQKAEANDRATNEQSLLDDRLKARKEFSEKSIEILNLEVQKEKALFNEKMVDDLEKNNVAYKNKDITAKEWAKNIVAINKRYNNEIATVDMAFSLKWNDLLNADADFYYKIQEEKRAFTEKTNDLILQNEKDKNKKIADNQVSGVKFTLAVRQKAFEEFIRLSKKELDIAKAKELANAKSNEEVIFITEKYAKLIEQLGLIPSETQKAQEATEAYIRSLGNGAISKAFDEIGFSSAKMFLDIDENGQSTFDKLYEGANELGEKFALVFQSIGDIAQEVFAKMAEASTERLNKEISNLTMERDVALVYAGENVAGREEINRQFEARKKQAEIRDFERKKKIAKANVLIDTAQAIISLYAENNWVTATILGGILTGVSLYQMAQIDKQQPPAYEHGTDNHIGGLMKINDQKGSNYKEIVQTPDGKMRMFNERNKVLNAPKGTKVFTASESALMFDNGLNNMLLSNGISMPKVEVNNNGALTDSQVNAIVGAIKNKETTNINIDKSGLNTFVRDGHTTKQIVNNRVRGIGKKV